jgi:hypothetical protein
MQKGDVMELANVIVALGNDKGNTVPKYGVTAAEIAVLCTIHGADAVFDIEPTGETVERGHKEERDRLLEFYRAADGGKARVLDVYPGHMPVLHTHIADLGLPPEAFKATARVQPAKAPAKIKAPKAKPAPVVEDDLFETAPADVME